MKQLAAAIMAVGFIWGSSPGLARALPGQSTEEVAAWIQANPTLQPQPGEKFLVRKSATPAQRFTFQASVLTPGLVQPSNDPGTIRSESIKIFDMINGITPVRLAESLRVIYGIDVFQDYDQAQVVYQYPRPPELQRARGQETAIYAARQGQLRLGQRFAYWVEVVTTPEGRAYNGSMTILLREDLDKLEAELRNL